MPPRKGYKQTAEHIAKRIRSGPDHHNWKGDAVSERGGRSRALRLYGVQPCTNCGNPKAERHHIDGNTANNEPSNIAIICRRCHMLHDGRLDAFNQLARVNQPRAVAIWRERHIDTSARSGDPCPQCGHKLGIVGVRRTGMVYIGCRKERGGCGFNAGSYRRT